MRPEFTIEELYAISLCVGWIIPLSEGDSPDAVHRKKYGLDAIAAFRRVYGDSYHSLILAALEGVPR